LHALHVIQADEVIVITDSLFNFTTQVILCKFIYFWISKKLSEQSLLPVVIISAFYNITIL